MHDVVLIAVSSFHPKKTSQCLEVVILIVSLRPELTIKIIHNDERLENNPRKDL